MICYGVAGAAVFARVIPNAKPVAPAFESVTKMEAEKLIF